MTSAAGIDDGDDEARLDAAALRQDCRDGESSSNTTSDDWDGARVMADPPCYFAAVNLLGSMRTLILNSSKFVSSIVSPAVERRRRNGNRIPLPMSR